MKLKIVIELAGAAFWDKDNPAPEVARRLRSFAYTIERLPVLSPGVDIPITDINGSEIGHAGVYE